MTWQLLIAIYLSLGGASFLFRRHLAVKLPKYNRIINGFFFVCILFPVGLVSSRFFENDLNVGLFNLIALLIGSAIFSIINLLAFKASKDVDAGSFSLISNVAPIVTVAFAALLLHESLSSQQLLGAIIIMASAIIVTLPGVRLKYISQPKGIFIAVLCMVLLGLSIVYERWILTRVDFGAYLVIGWGFQAMWMAMIAWPERKNLKILKKKENFLPILGYGLSNSLKGLCFIGALVLSGSASLPTVSISFNAVIVVLAAYIFLKERKHLWLKMLAAIIGSIGLIILASS